ncbi:nose resistant to fluoxetine protein 6-like, partial [Teleopsis dalmanni]|uniref:nose resistant to fluoxetine protein 6-like n=1 Tax=Teleopsis dalmanni TaxID=139649 RepID=UPI0018CD6F6F
YTKNDKNNIDPVNLSVPINLINSTNAESEELSLVADVPTDAYITATEFDRFLQSLNFIKETRCRKDLNTTLWNIVSGKLWAIAMYDATVKTPVGIESGILHQFGHFDQCLEQTKYVEEDLPKPVEIPVRAKYCLANVTLTGVPVLNIASRYPSPLNRSALVHWGVCVPASCDSGDVATFLQFLLQRQQIKVDDNMCQLQSNDLVVTNGMFIYAGVILFILLLAFLSTIYHINLIWNTKQNNGITKTGINNDTLTTALLSFSIIENLRKIFQCSKDQLGLNSINGVKALAMILILIGHAGVFIIGAPISNLDFVKKEQTSLKFPFLFNSLLFVDLFLLLSGFLFCRILLIELERRRGKLNVLVLYIARFIRLTPAYIVVIGFYMTWLPNIGDGPIWKQRIQIEQERCQESWWLNILYINNYFNTNSLCMFQSWYLAVDTQLFFLAPIAIYMLYKLRKYGVRFLAVMIAITSAIPFFETFQHKTDPTFMVYPEEIADISLNKYYNKFYIKTHMRASAYVLGLLTGYLVHRMQESSYKLPKLFVKVTWIASTIIGVASMYSITRFYIAPYNLLETVLYAGLHKIGWNLSIAWLVLATTTGHAGWLQSLLSQRFFAPISRLAYCAYLCNGIVELYFTALTRTSEYKSVLIMQNHILGHVFTTFCLALVLCVLFESPIHALERILLRTSRVKKAGSETTEQTDSSNTGTPNSLEE